MFSSSADLFGLWNERGTCYNEYPLIVSNCGFQRFITKQHDTDRPHGRIDYNLIYIQAGKGYFTSQNSCQVLPSGSIFLYPPDVPQRYSFRASDSTEIYWMHFSGYATSSILEKLGISDGPHTVGNATEIELQYRKIIRELQLKNPSYDYLVSGLLLELLSVFSRRLSLEKNHSETVEDSGILDVINMMYTEYNQKYSTQRYAEHCNLSTYRFIHKFKEITGTSPLEYITGIRIDEAKHLLLTSSYNISEIAEIVGFDNPLYFSRVFKKVVSMSPSDYRKQQ